MAVGAGDGHAERRAAGIRDRVALGARAAAVGGRIFYFGIPDDAYYPINMQGLLRKNLTLMSGITLQRRTMLARAGSYLEAHPALLDTFVSDTFTVDEAQGAYELATTPVPDTAKVTIRIAS